MKKIILSIFFIMVSFGIFFTFIDAKYQRNKELRSEELKYDEALNNSKELLKTRDDLLSKYNTFSFSDIEKVEKLIPDNIDNIKLILEIDKIASRNMMLVDSVSITSSENENKKRNDVEEVTSIASSESRDYNYVDLSFSTVGTYKKIISFIKDLGRSLRIIDIRKLSFSSGGNGAYKVSFKIRTYWLKK